MGEPWRNKTDEDFERACAACEIHVRIVSQGALTELLVALRFDRRRAGSAGRALDRDLPSLGLRKHDRLEPSAGCPDTFALDARSDFPINLVFWRTSQEGMVRHRCPLFSRRSGISATAICVDELHTLHLGIFQDFVLAALWQIIEQDVFGERGGLSEDAYTAKVALVLRSRLFGWYRMEKKKNPAKPLYELADFGLATIGSKDKPALAAKAAESGTLVAWARSLVAQYRHQLPRGPALAHCGDALVEYMEATRAASLRMSARQRQATADALCKFLHFREEAGIAWKPKAHLASHMIADCVRFGNPVWTGTWLDEGLNKDLAAVCKTAHTLVWSRRVLASFAHVAGPSARLAAQMAKRQKVRS